MRAPQLNIMLPSPLHKKIIKIFRLTTTQDFEQQNTKIQLIQSKKFYNYYKTELRALCYQLKKSI